LLERVSENDVANWRECYLKTLETITREASA